jgi:nitrogen fixation NifU-like protein
MNPELRELYQSLILEHGKNPRFFREIDGYTHKLEGYNPLCGDKIVLYIKVQDGIIQDIGFTGAGCAISMASTSLMNEAIKGKPVEYAEQLLKQFQNIVTGRNDDCEHCVTAEIESGKLHALSGVKEFPSRIKCAMLPWHTFKHAIHDAQEPVSTE